MDKRLRNLFYLLIFILAPSALQGSGKIDFNRDIRPIFSDKCFTCHGPHEEKRKGHLRLDTNKGKDSAFRIHKGSQAFKPGSLDESEAWQRINTDDEDDIMPPLKTHKTLSQAEKNLIGKWIEAGAPWADHWSYIPPKKSALPDVKDKTWAQKPLDYFILSKLVDMGLAPSKEAPRHKLIRRVAYDLTGLPPTLAEVDAFENDMDPKAYEKMVDHFLRSKHYGERMALNWMDLARYGDTSVYHADGPRDMWPWRDWVIEAFNDNMPYDQFSIMQLAGDLMPNPTYEQKLATAFLRNNGTTDEGGAFDEEYRVTYAVDRTVTTSKVWMGLTMECAQCHDHKYDPLPQKDFYRMYAFFNISDDKGLQTRTGNAEPMMKILTKEQRRRAAELEEMLQPYKVQQEQVRIKSQPEFKKWAERENAYSTSANIELAGMVHHFPLQEKESKLSRDLLHPEIKPEGKKKPKTFADPILKGMNFYNKDNLKFKHAGHWLDRDTPFSFSFWMRSTMAEQSASFFSKMNENDNFKGFDCWIENHRVGVHLIHEWPINSIKVLSNTRLSLEEKWQHVAVTYDGSSKSAGISIYINGQKSETSTMSDSLTLSIKNDIPFHIGSRNIQYFFSGQLSQLRIFDRVLTKAEMQVIHESDLIRNIMLKPTAGRTPQEQQILGDYYYSHVHPESIEIAIKMQPMIEEMGKINSTTQTCMIMKDQAQPRKTHVLDRGQYDKPLMDQEVSANTPGVLPPMPADLPKNRLGLARWLMARDNPLTARVTVNRIWAMLFDKGLVGTVSDFGAQGTPPTHSELLDWLAVDFIENGWDLKRLIKDIVMSSTYRQDSVCPTTLQEQDPQNTWLARGPRYRLQGDFIRDTALQLGGLLVNKIGGPGVKPYEPPGLWEEVVLGDANLVKTYKQDSGEKLYRRSMYTFWKRSSPPPNMLTFDAPSREKCLIQRQKTNTPLQALVLLNDPQFIEASRCFAERIIREGGPRLDEKIKFAYKSATAHMPDDTTIREFQNLYQSTHMQYQKDERSADKLLAIGDKPRDATLGKSEVAAWTVVANVILNLDETLSKE